MSLDYLKRSLDDRERTAKDAFAHEIMRVAREANAAGALHGSRTYIAYTESAKSVLDREMRSMIQFAFNLFGDPSDEVYGAVAASGQRILDHLIDTMNKKAEGNDRAFGGGYKAIVDRQKPELDRKLAGLLDGYKHGIMGDHKLKKEPSVSVVNTQNNSPGAVQQVGAGNVSVSTSNQYQQSLIQEIEKIRAAPEFQELSNEKKDEWTDIADVVRTEAEKATPDQGKLKRWGKKLVDFTADVGMKFASETLASYLAKMSGA